jgi:Flp pilus assembly protein CpaB
MIGAGLVGLVLTIALVRQADRREDIAVASSALTPGTVFGDEHVRWTPVRVESDVPVVRRGDLSDLDGMIVTRRIAEGDILSPHDFRPPAATEDLRAMSIPIARARAVNGDLQPGDRVDVIHASGDDVRIVVADAEVLDVHDDSGGALRGGLGEFSVTLAVTTVESQLLTGAVTDGNVIIVRSTGATSAAGEPPVSIRSSQG